jgi:hypothetical protein
VNWSGRLFWVTFFGRTKKVTRTSKGRNQGLKTHDAQIKNKQKPRQQGEMQGLNKDKNTKSFEIKIIISTYKPNPNQCPK